MANAVATAVKVEASSPPPDSPITFTLSRGLVALERQGNAKGEAFRVLRTHIMARHVQDGRRALAICSPAGKVGCTFVAVNLAVTLSQIGVKTLLIDANMRTPGVDQFFQPSTPVMGLQQCLAPNALDYMSYIQPDVLPDLSILFAGGTPSNPQELLATDRFSDLVNSCMRDFDVTIVDTPAANSCSDAHRVSSVAGYSIVVARRDRTLVGDVKILVSQLESDRARVVGTVLTEN